MTKLRLPKQLFCIHAKKVKLYHGLYHGLPVWRPRSIIELYCRGNVNVTGVTTAATFFQSRHIRLLHHRSTPAGNRVHRLSHESLHNSVQNFGQNDLKGNFLASKLI